MEAVRDVTPYQTTCDPPGLHRMTRDSDEPSKPSNILGRQARYPTQADRGGMSRNPNLAPGRGPDGSGKLRTSRDQMRNHRLPLVSVGLVSTWSRGRVGPEAHSSKGHSTSPDNHTPGWRLGYGPLAQELEVRPSPKGCTSYPLNSRPPQHPRREATEAITQPDCDTHEETSRPTTSNLPPGRGTSGPGWMP